MHMADALLSPAVSVVMAAVSAGVMVYSAAEIRKESGLVTDDSGDRKIPTMGVMGAFVFAAQMINFTIPATGSSGHIGGGILLAAMLGPHAAFLTLAVVLAIQCLFFADGGLLALGCNIFNMGFYACFIAYPYIFKPIVRKRPGAKSIAVASAASATAGLLLGAFSVVLETLASGITELPFSAFITLMLPIHLAIGIGEGIITGAVLCFVLQMRPELLDFSGIGETNAENQGLLSFKKTLATLLVLAALVSGGLSLFASAYPDGLEWSMEKVAGTSELERDGGAYKAASEIQEATAFMPDYDFKSAGEEGSAFGTGTAGIVGGALTLGVACAVGAILNASIKRKEKNAAA